ncbi:MAG TPA: DUF2169 domain-containing protein [Phycisphaerae bacterium]|nr:DUF2169 domain-containing protein [Phycisphaerae bacterium]
MLQLKNNSRFKAMIMMAPDPKGVDTLFAVVKGTFAIGDKGVIAAADQLPIVAADVLHGEPGKSSIKTPSDVSLMKPAADVLLLGHAYAQGGRATQVDVSMRVGTLTRTLRVTGNRTWASGLLGAKMSDPEPFDKMPLMWERSFGGFDSDAAKPEVVKYEERNPVGAGFRFVKKNLAGAKMPNIEDPAHLVRGWQDRPPPAGTGPIGGAWQPRKAFAGTYDDAWQKSRAPYLPTDFDPRFLQLAPPEQIMPALEGGEPVELVHVTPSGRLAFALPKYKVGIAFNLDGKISSPPVKLDTCILEPDASRCVLVWRAALACDKKALRVREVVIDATAVK